MQRLFKFSTALVMLAILSLAGSAAAESRATSPFSGDTVSGDTVRLLESFRPQFEAVDHNTREGRELYAQLQDELADGLSRLAADSRPVTKGKADCETACTFANSAKAFAALAKVYADTAAASSDPDCNSVYTDDAQYFADVASATADFAAPFACGGAKNAQTAQDLLESAERRASKTFINAWFSNLNGCSASLATATQAQLARDALFNGAFYAGQCN